MVQERHNGHDIYGIDRAQAEVFISAIAGSAEATVSFQFFDDKRQGRVRPGHCHGTITEKFNLLSDLNRGGAGINAMIDQDDLRGRAGAPAALRQTRDHITILCPPRAS